MASEVFSVKQDVAGSQVPARTFHANLSLGLHGRMVHDRCQVSNTVPSSRYQLSQSCCLCGPQNEGEMVPNIPEMPAGPSSSLVRPEENELEMPAGLSVSSYIICGLAWCGVHCLWVSQSMSDVAGGAWVCPADVDGFSESDVKKEKTTEIRGLAGKCVHT